MFCTQIASPAYDHIGEFKKNEKQIIYLFDDVQSRIRFERRFEGFDVGDDRVGRQVSLFDVVAQLEGPLLLFVDDVTVCDGVAVVGHLALSAVVLECVGIADHL